MMIFAEAEAEAEVLLGLCIVVVSLAFLLANALVFDGCFVDLEYVDDRGVRMRHMHYLLRSQRHNLRSRIGGCPVASIHRESEKESSRKPLYGALYPYASGPGQRADLLNDGRGTGHSM